MLLSTGKDHSREAGLATFSLFTVGSSWASGAGPGPTRCVAVAGAGASTARVSAARR